MKKIHLCIHTPIHLSMRPCMHPSIHPQTHPSAPGCSTSDSQVCSCFWKSPSWSGALWRCMKMWHCRPAWGTDVGRSCTDLWFPAGAGERSALNTQVYITQAWCHCRRPHIIKVLFAGAIDKQVTAEDQKIVLLIPGQCLGLGHKMVQTHCELHRLWCGVCGYVCMCLCEAEMWEWIKGHSGFGLPCVSSS